MKIPPRPSSRDLSVCRAVAAEAESTFISLGGITKAALEQAFLKECDEYHQARALTSLGFEVDARIVQALIALRSTWIEAETDATLAWVIEHGIRFPAKVGQTIRFMPEGRRYNVAGKVVSILPREARAIVEVEEGVKSQHISAAAESVIQILDGSPSLYPIAAESVRNTVGFQVLQATAQA